jgi:hypothetical protein
LSFPGVIEKGSTLIFVSNSSLQVSSIFSLKLIWFVTTFFWKKAKNIAVLVPVTLVVLLMYYWQTGG